MHYRLNVFPTAESLLDALAEAFLLHIRKVLHTEALCRIVLGGGRTPVQLNRLIVGRAARFSCDWTKVHVCFSDERMVPADHQDNTAAMIRRTLAQPLAMPEANIHPIPTDVNPAVAARAYDRLLNTFRQVRSEPLFHLALLGLGPDGHTASLFPGSPALACDGALAVEAGSGPDGHRRITLTFPALSAADHVWFMASGRESNRFSLG